MLTASSNLAYLVENSSLEIPSLTDWPWGQDKSRISLTEPSGLGAEPMGEQWVWGKGGERAGSVSPGKFLKYGLSNQISVVQS